MITIQKLLLISLPKSWMQKTHYSFFTLLVLQVNQKECLHYCWLHGLHGYTFKNVFNYKENDIYWCTADIGWITGHSYILYGYLTNGATTVIFEGVPTYPEPDRFWAVIENTK